jgi:hypothetical protein
VDIDDETVQGSHEPEDKYSMAQEYKSKMDGNFTTIRKESLDSQDFSLICELLD